MSGTEINARASGFFLIPRQEMSANWRQLTRHETDRVIGRGYPTTIDDSQDFFNWTQAAFNQETQKIDIIHVPFQGATVAIREIIAGQIQMMFVTLPPAIGHIQQGTVRALAVSTIERSTAIPSVPSLYELGMKEFDFGAWQGVLA